MKAEGYPPWNLICGQISISIFYLPLFSDTYGTAASTDLNITSSLNDTVLLNITETGEHSNKDSPAKSTNR